MKESGAGLVQRLIIKEHVVHYAGAKENHRNQVFISGMDSLA